MRALTVVPGVANSATLRAVPDPPPEDGPVLVETLTIGLCGTDREIVRGGFGQPPRGADYLVLGHESLGRVVEAPVESGLSAGDLVVGIVRRPDPVPCANCAVGEWDMCRNGRYTERGIKGRHGYGSETFRTHAEFAFKVGPDLGQAGVLLEPATVVAKAWEHVEHIGHRAHWSPQKVLITGAGPIGLLAALLGVQRGLQVRVLDQTESGPKPELVRALGASYHTNLSELDNDSDVIIECTGSAPLVADIMTHHAHNAIICLTGLSSHEGESKADIGRLNRDIVLRNITVFGSINANRRHYEQAANALTQADLTWLERVITRRVPFADFTDALITQEDDVKVVLDIGHHP
jgi:glucose 1-dehydrogenase